MSDLSLRPRSLFVLFVALAVVWFGTLDYRKLIKPDEGRYAEIAREMAVSGDWITPRLNGIKYFEKPPLQYWVTAAAFKAFGENEWTARLWPGLTGFAGLLLTFFVGRRLFGRDTAILSTAMLSGSLIYVLIGHLNTLDMGLTFFLHLALCGFLVANQPGAPPASIRRWMLTAWTALACAVLTKGLVAPVLLGGTLVAYSVTRRDWSPWRRLELARGLALFLLIAAPWFIAVSRANPEFFNFFFIHEHFERFLTKVHRRDEPAWYFLPVLAAGALPWTLVAIHGFAASLRTMRETGFGTRWFLLLWVMLVFAFFSVSSSKLPSYILPLFPALAWLAADAARRWSRRALLIHFGIVAAFAATAVVLLPEITRFASDETPREMLQVYADWLVWAAAIWLAGALGACFLAWKQQPQRAFLALAVAAFVGHAMQIQGHEALGRSNSAHYIAGRVEPLLSPGVPFYSVKTYEQTLPFYLRRTMTLVNFADEMRFGLEQEPDKWVPAMAAFTQRWQADRDAFAAMGRDTYERLRKEGLPMEIVAQDTRRIIVRKPPSP
ncbi:MAG: glycosyltransferase family 39 protein [Rhodocyclaceae bacterium]